MPPARGSVDGQSAWKHPSTTAGMPARGERRGELLAGSMRARGYCPSFIARSLDLAAAARQIPDPVEAAEEPPARSCASGGMDAQTRHDVSSGSHNSTRWTIYGGGHPCASPHHHALFHATGAGRRAANHFARALGLSSDARWKAMRKSLAVNLAARLIYGARW
jgi:hypothetical protein